MKLRKVCTAVQTASLKKWQKTGFPPQGCIAARSKGRFGRCGLANSNIPHCLSKEVY